MSLCSFVVNCSAGGQKANVPFKVGYPEPTHHPIHFQADQLGKTRGVSVPQNVMDALSKLYDLSIKNNLDFGELTEYAMKSAAAENANSIGGKPNSDPDKNEESE